MTVNPWPEDDLEPVPNCPVCGDTRRRLLHGGLTDRVFHIADGLWNLYQCAVCESGYLDPRPTPESISRAYAGYYTHDVEDHPIVRRKGKLRSILHDWINGYQNQRYGMKREPASSMGRWLLPWLPSLRSAADAECRHLPPLPQGGGRLLDVGCGNGGFLVLARQAGWTVEGVDFDPEAVATACSRGLHVQQGGIELLDGQQAHYDVITICHVIEHLHDPVAILKRLYMLLNPGGVLWLDTPNLGSLGARRFGPYWRGLETPRHLVLFDCMALREMLHRAGFSGLVQRWRGMTVFNVFAESAVGQQQINLRQASHNGRPPLLELLAELREMLQPSQREFLTFIAHK